MGVEQLQVLGLLKRWKQKKRHGAGVEGVLQGGHQSAGLAGLLAWQSPCLQGKRWSRMLDLQPPKHDRRCRRAG